MKLITKMSFLMAMLSASLCMAQSETRVSNGMNGEKYTFTHDTSHPLLGNAFRDPSGMIWGDVVSDEKGFIKRTREDAAKYCAIIGAKLPSRKDFERLVDYMGDYKEGPYGIGGVFHYRPQVLPNFNKKEDIFMTSNSDYAFISVTGKFLFLMHSEVFYYAGIFRCVVQD